MTEGVDKRGRHRVMGDIEVVEGSLRLSSVIAIRGYVDRAHGVALFTSRPWLGSSRCHLGMFMDENRMK